MRGPGEAAGVDLYLDQQNIGTTTPMGKLLFQVTGAFAEFERSMIRQRVRAGLKTIKATIEREGKFTSKAGVMRSRLGRPGAEPDKVERARVELAKGRRHRQDRKAHRARHRYRAQTQTRDGGGRVISRGARVSCCSFRFRSGSPILGVNDCLRLTRDALSAEGRSEYLIPLYLWIMSWFFIYCYPIARWTIRLERKWAVHD
jgi:Resolvase, N terminal domain